jgi:hypothetical protein
LWSTLWLTETSPYPGLVLRIIMINYCIDTESHAVHSCHPFTLVEALSENRVVGWNAHPQFRGLP